MLSNYTKSLFAKFILALLLVIVVSSISNCYRTKPRVYTLEEFLKEFYELAPALTVISPNSGEYWSTGTWHYIRWKTGGPQYVNIYLSRDGGNSWENIGSGENIGKWPWEVSGKPSDNCLIKVSSATDPSAYYDISDGVFTISHDKIKVVSPDGGEVWSVGTERTIFWKSDEAVQYVNIYTSNDGGINWETSKERFQNTGSCKWKVSGNPSANCLIKVSDAVHIQTYDISDVPFTIIRHVRIVTPTQNEFRYPGESFVVRWITSGLDGNVKIEYSITDDRPSYEPWATITPSTIEDTGYYASYDWKIPNAPTEYARVKVTHLTYNKHLKNSDMSYPPFTILRHLRVMAPSEGATLYSNKSYTIMWVNSGIGGEVKIDYYDGTSWSPIAPTTPDNGSFPWTIPNTPTDEARVRITHLRYSDNVAASGTFTIVETPATEVSTPAVAIVSGKVTDPEGNLLSAQVSWEDLDTGKKLGTTKSDFETGKFSINLSAGRKYAWIVSKDRYLFASGHIDLTRVSKREINLGDVILTPIGPKQEIILHNIFFDFDKADLRPESVWELERLIDIMKRYPKMKVEIQGHTCATGTDEYNMELGRRRAMAVVDYLAEHGINPSRLQAKSYGSTRPIASNETEEGREKNRRVVFKILSVE